MILGGPLQAWRLGRATCAVLATTALAAPVAFAETRATPPSRAHIVARATRSLPSRASTRRPSRRWWRPTGSGARTRNQDNLVRAGTAVHAGDRIATVGRTGIATADHVHFEILHRGRAYNPLYLLPLPARVAQVDESGPEEAF